MKIHHCKQGGDQWHALRTGIPTASIFNKLMTPKTHEMSAQRYPLMYRLAAERILGVSLDREFSSAAMEAGREFEPKARAWYEMAHDCEVEQVGICISDCGRYGASPDGLVGDTGLIELKCPEAQTHVGYLLGDLGAYADYSLQIQGQLWVAERDWCDSVSYCSPFPCAMHRHHADLGLIAKLSAAVLQFCDELDACVERLKALGAVEQQAEQWKDEQGRDAALGMTDAEAEQFAASLMEAAQA